MVGQGRPIPRDELAEVLWENAPPATWEKALGVLASKLRVVLGELGASTLTAAFGCYRLELPEGSWVDVVAAVEAADEAEAAIARDDIEAAKRAAALAESLIRGPFLPGEYGTWVEQKRRELAGVRARALSALAEACLRSGETQDSVRWAEQAVEAEPFRESGYRLLMEAHIGAGNRAEALRVYERCRLLLAEELGAFPSPETEALYRELLEAPVAGSPDAPHGAAAESRDGGGTSRRQKIAAGFVLLFAAGAAAAIFAVESRGSPSPKVVRDSLIRIDPQSLRVTQVIPLPSTQPDLVVVSGRYVWVTSHILRDVGTDSQRFAGDRTLTRVDPSSAQAVPVGGGLAPCGLATDPSGDVWVANCYSRVTGSRDNVVRVDAKTLRFRTPWPVPGGAGYYRGLVYGDGRLWVGNVNGTGLPAPTITEIDPRGGIKRTIRPQLLSGGIAWANGYDNLWVSHFNDGSVTRVNPLSGRTTEVVRDVLVNPVEPHVYGDNVWVGDWARPEVAHFRAKGAPNPRRIALPTRDHLASVWGLAVGAGYIWATTPRDYTVWRIDPTTDKATPIRIPYLPAGVAADENNVWVTVRGD